MVTASARERGFVLVETLVSLIIVALVLGALFETVALTAGNARAAADTRMALMVAESQIAAAGTAAPLTPGTYGGVTDGYRWQVEIRPAGGLAVPAAELRVTAGTPANPALVRLTTLRLAGAP